MFNLLFFIFYFIRLCSISLVLLPPAISWEGWVFGTSHERWSGMTCLSKYYQHVHHLVQAFEGYAVQIYY